MTPERRDEVAAAAAVRYRAGESWQAIGAHYGLSGEHVRRLARSWSYVFTYRVVRSVNCQTPDP